MTKTTRLNSVVIMGAGGFGREVLEIFKGCNTICRTWDIAGFIDEDERLHGTTINGYPVLGGLDWVRDHRADFDGCVCAIGDCETRKQVVERLQRVGVRFFNAIHPSVLMSEFVELGEDVIINPGAVLTVNVKIGDHVHIDNNASVAHDAVLGSYCRVNPGARINGNDRLGEGVYIGTGATLIQDLSIGDWSTVGAGAVVISDVPDRVVVVGVPAKVIRHKA